MTRSNKCQLVDAVRPVLEALEMRRLLSSSLPFVLDFESPMSSGLLDKDGEHIGFTHVQANKNGDHYQPGLLDFVTGNGALFVTSGPGSNRDFDNTLKNGLEIEFDAATSGFAITARLAGPLSHIDAPFEQGGVMFGPDQDNYIKFVALARSTGPVLQFNDEQTTNGVVSHVVDKTVSIGDFASILVLDLRLVGDPFTGKVHGEYAVNGGSFVEIPGATITLTGEKKTQFFSSAARGGLITMHNNSSGPVTIAYDHFEVRQRPAITAINPAPDSIDVRRDVFVGADLFLPNGALDPATVDSTSVKLFKTSTGTIVPASVNTSGGGDSIVLQPSNILDASTQYTFTVTSGVHDVSGFSLLPFSMTFTTGTEGGPPDTNVEFDKVLMPSTAGYNYTGVTVGPDNRVYAATVDGRIVRFPINSDGTLGTAQVINSLRNHYGGPRLMEGFVFDPASTADNLIIWATHGYFDFNSPPEWSGAITRLRGPDLEIVEDAIVGMPRSAHNHLTNQPVFGPLENGKRYLYFTQAGNTAQGSIDSTWGFRPERLLTAAVLRLDTSAITPGSPLNVQTEDLGNDNYNPWAPGAPLTIYATGLRNAYDIVWTHDGFLYAPNNGSNAGGATPATPSLPIYGSIRIDGDDDDDPTNGHYSSPAVPGISSLNEGQPDYLYQVEPGGYYGHPNPTRAEFVLNGGNPTGGSDPYEIKAYPAGTLPDRNFRGAAWNFGAKYSPNGIIEFRGNAFGGELDGSLMVVRFSGGDDVVILKRNSEGAIIEQQTGIPGLTGFADPLDLAQDPSTGFIYVAEYAGNRITLLRPISAPSEPPADVAATGTGPTRVVLEWTAVPTASRYLIQRQGPGESGFSDYALVTAPGFFDENVSAELTYQYRVRAENNGGNSPFSDPVSASTSAPGAWSIGVPLPQASAEGGADVINGRVYFAGESTPHTWEFDFATGVWTARTIRPFTGDSSNAEHSTHAFNGKLYLIGGLSGGAENKVQIYDPATDSWTLGADRPWNAGSSPSALINGEIYVAAGAVTTPSYSPVNRVAKYNPLNDTWTELAPMPSARHATLGATDGQRLWVFGGRPLGLEASDGTNTVQVYDPATNTWTTSDNPASGLAPIPRPVRGMSVAYFNGEFYIFGGENNSGGHGATSNKVFDRVDIYNPQTNTWRVGRPMPTARHATAVVTHGNKFYLIGGGVVSGTSFSTGVEVLDPLANPVPVAPTNLVAVTMSPSEIALGWNESADNETSFRILRSDDGVSFSLLAIVAANTITYSDTTVVDGNVYYYRVDAVNAAGISDPTNTASAEAGEPQAPAVPGAVTATAVSTTRVELRWNHSVGATSYQIERRLAGETNFIVVATTSQNTHLDQGLTRDTTYEYRVRAHNAVGFSDYSALVTVTTPFSTPLTSLDINTPVSGTTTVVTEGVDYDVTAGGINIWGTSDSFRFVYADVSGDFDVMVQITDVSMDRIKAGLMARESLAAESRHVYSSISSSDSHRFATRLSTGGQTTNAFNDVMPILPDVWLRLKRVGDVFSAFYSTNGTNWVSMGNVTLAMPHALYFGLAVSAQSSSSTGTVQFRNLEEVPGTAPAAPANLAAVPFSHDRIDVTWSASAGAANYRVQRRLTDGSFADVALTSSTSFSDIGLTASTTYEYRVIAENQYGASLPSTSALATTPAAPTAPDAPATVTAVAFSYRQIDVSWSESPGATSYRLQRSIAGGAFQEIASGITGQSYKDLGLDAGTLHEYRVIAENAVGQSPPSVVGGATTDPAPSSEPEAPAGVTATAVSADQVDLTWNKAVGAAAYSVQRRLTGGVFADVAINLTTLAYSDRGLSGNTTYEYRVIAHNDLGSSAPSATATATTPSPAYVGADIGGPIVSGSTTPVDGSGTAYDLVAGGEDIWGTADQFHFAYREITGDFDIRVRVNSLAEADLWSKAGLMARQSLVAGSANVFVLASTVTNNTHRFTYRTADGGLTTSSGSGAVSYPNTWLRLQRVGNTFTGFRSTDGMSWIQVGSVTMELSPTLYFGLAATSRNASASTTAEFRDLSSTPPPEAPTDLAAAPAASDAVNLNWTPAPGASLYRIERQSPGDPGFVVIASTTGKSYQDLGLIPESSYVYRIRAENEQGSSDYSLQVSITLPSDGTYVGTDVGGPAFLGSASPVGDGAFDVTAGGADIWGTADQLYFINARLTGDFDVRVRINASSLPEAKLGLMARESLEGSSRNVFSGMAADAFRLSRRAVPGGATANTFKGGTPALPNVWLRLRRIGTAFTGFYSVDGVAWTQMGSVSMTMPQTLYVGLAASARSATTPATVEFRNFSEVASSPPVAPTNLGAVAVSESAIGLSWTASPGIVTYVLQRRTGGGSFATVASGVAGTTYSDDGLLPGTTYEYQVLAQNSVGLSTPSNTASATTNPPSQSPSAPSNLTATIVSHDWVDLGWDASTGATSYRVQRRLVGGTFGDIAVGLAATSFSDTGLTPGTTYEYQVLAENAAGLSPPSNIASVTTPTGWVYAGTDIGTSLAGSTTRLDDSSYSVTGAGADIWGKADQFHFAHRQLTGNFDIRVQITSVSLSQAKAGLMARETLDANSRHVFAGIGVDDAFRLAARRSTGGNTSNVFKNVPPVLPDAWLRLRRIGDVFTGFYSIDGTTWTQMGSVTMALPQTIYFGMAVSSKNTSATATAEFRNLGDTVL